MAKYYHGPFGPRIIQDEVSYHGPMGPVPEVQMANLHIAEYRGVAQAVSSHRILEAPLTPPVAEQVLTYTTTAVSSAFNADTRFIQVTTDGTKAFLEFAAAPTAAATNGILLATNETRLFGVIPGQKVAAYDGISE